MGLLLRVVRCAVLKFTLGFVPEFIIPALGLAGKLPQLVGTRSDLVIGRTGHIWTRCLNGCKTIRALRRMAMLVTVHSGFRLHSHNSRPDIFVPVVAYFARCRFG